MVHDPFSGLGDRNKKPSSPCVTFKEPDRSHPGMLDVKLGNGDQYGLPYTYLTLVGYSRSDGITLEFAARTITIRGRNLGPVYDALLKQSVVAIRPLGEINALGEDEIAISSITVEAPAETIHI